MWVIIEDLIRMDAAEYGCLHGKIKSALLFLLNVVFFETSSNSWDTRSHGQMQTHTNIGTITQQEKHRDKATYK